MCRSFSISLGCLEMFLTVRKLFMVSAQAVQVDYIVLSCCWLFWIVHVAKLSLKNFLENFIGVKIFVMLSLKNSFKYKLSRIVCARFVVSRFFIVHIVLGCCPKNSLFLCRSGCSKHFLLIDSGCYG